MQCKSALNLILKGRCLGRNSTWYLRACLSIFRSVQVFWTPPARRLFRGLRLGPTAHYSHSLDHHHGQGLLHEIYPSRHGTSYRYAQALRRERSFPSRITSSAAYVLHRSLDDQDQFLDLLQTARIPNHLLPHLLVGDNYLHYHCRCSVHRRHSVQLLGGHSTRVYGEVLESGGCQISGYHSQSQLRSRRVDRSFE